MVLKLNSENFDSQKIVKIIETIILILDKDIDNQKSTRRVKPVAEAPVLKNVTQMMDSLLISLNDEYKVISLNYFINQEQEIDKSILFL